MSPTEAAASRSDRRRPVAALAPPWWPARPSGRLHGATVIGLADGLTVAVALALARAGRFHALATRARPAGVPPLALVLLLGPLWVASLAVHGAYDRPSIGGDRRLARVLEGQFRFVAATALILLAVRADVAAAVVGPLLGATALTLAIHAAWERRRAGAALQRVVVVGGEEAAAAVAERIMRGAGAAVVGLCIPGRRRGEHVAAGAHTVPVLGEPAEVLDPRRLRDIDCVVVAGEEAASGACLRDLFRGACVDVLVAPAVLDLPAPRAGLVPVGGLPLLQLCRDGGGTVASLAAQAVERVVAAAALIAVLPVLVTAAAAVRLTSPGPALFRQTRLGHGGRPFRLVKLRTMRLGAAEERDRLLALNEHDGVLFKIRRDPRVTPVGRILRRLSLDEVPQLWNVVRGDMRLVGPRPALPEEVDRYEGLVSRRLLVKPGLTGLWQVSGRADLSWAEGVDLDLRYVDNRSPAADLAILCRTVGALVRGKGAY